MKLLVIGFGILLLAIMASAFLSAIGPSGPALEPIGNDLARDRLFFRRVQLRFSHRPREIYLKTNAVQTVEQSLLDYTVIKDPAGCLFWVSIGSRAEKTWGSGTKFRISPNDIIRLGDECYHFGNMSREGVQVTNVTSQISRHYLNHTQGVHFIWLNAVDTWFLREIIHGENGKTYEANHTIDAVIENGRKDRVLLSITRQYGMSIPKQYTPKRSESFALADRDSFCVNGRHFTVNRIVPTTEMQVGRLVGWVELDEK